MKIFLTGGSGFIGKKFIKECLNSGHIIYALSRKKKQNNKNLIWLKGDLDNEDWFVYLKKTNILVHMAAAGVNNHASMREAISENVIKPYKLLINALNSKCYKWLLIGSSSEYCKQAKVKKLLSTKTKEFPETNYEKTKLLFTKLSFSLSKNLKRNVEL